MSSDSKDAIHGLTCPRCGGTVAIPEGQVIVACPYCEQRSVVSTASGGDIGVRRYQAPLKISREQAEATFRQFISGKFQVARDAASQSTVSEIFLVHLPFWAVWGRAAAYAFGQVEVGSGDNKHYEAREKKAIREMNWNCPACEVGEFGVRQISLDGCTLNPFNAEELHRTGMVFEPVGSEQAAMEAARSSFEEKIKKELSMDRTSQIFTRVLRPRLGLLYYPLWVVRYLYRGRSFQVVVDGFDGKVLYGKAPGSVAYRAGVLIAGMAAGSIVTVDVPALILSLSSNSHSSDSNDNVFIFALIAFVAGLGILYASYRTFRYGEHYEYHRFGAAKGAIANLPLNLPGNLREVNDIVKNLEKYQ